MRFKNLDHVASTGEPSQVSANSSHLKGLKSEFIVAMKCCEGGSELIAHRLRSPFGEIDLVFKAQGRIQLVEVKSLGPRAIIDGRIGRRQRYRLTNCLSWAQGKWRMPTHMHLALVNNRGIIRWIPDFLS